MLAINAFLFSAHRKPEDATQALAERDYKSDSTYAAIQDINASIASIEVLSAGVTGELKQAIDLLNRAKEKQLEHLKQSAQTFPLDRLKTLMKYMIEDLGDVFGQLSSVLQSVSQTEEKDLILITNVQARQRVFRMAHERIVYFQNNVQIVYGIVQQKHHNVSATNIAALKAASNQLDEFKIMVAEEKDKNQKSKAERETTLKAAIQAVQSFTDVLNNVNKELNE